MSDQILIEKAAKYVKNRLIHFEESGHDWFHTYRVWQTAKEIANHTDCDLKIVELGALFHDIADAKFNKGDETLAVTQTEQWLMHENAEKQTIESVLHIVKNISWRKQYQFSPNQYPELAVVQDADRLDAIGAVGIARAFSFGGFAKRPIHIPDSEKERVQGKQDTISHFYEKLLYIKDSLHTNHARHLAKGRHEFMLQFLNQINKELMD